MKINSFSHFRAISIIFIIAGHSYGVSNIQVDAVVNVAFLNVIAGGTSLFVFISGFLFHHIFYESFNYKKFIFNKCKNVFIPYLILGSIPVLLLVVLKSDMYDGFFLPNGDGFVNEYIIPTLKYYASGRFLNAYWYIPFIILTFTLSQLHIKYIKLSFKSQFLIIMIFSVIAVFLHRPIGNINVIQSVVYYTPLYLIGISASIHKELIYEYLRGKEIYLILPVIVLAFYQAFLGDVGNYHKAAFVYGGIDLMFVQKLFLCFFFMVLLYRFESYNNIVLSNIASTSFTAFFIHPFILFFISKLELEFLKVGSWLVYVAMIGFISIFCVLLAKLTRQFIPKYSRYIIGY